MMTNKNLIYIAGPTGVGKTELSIAVAKKLNTEIISCDSRQFFKELKIGTSPPSKKQLKEVNHHFIHNKSIHDVYNVGLYEKEATKVLTELFHKKDNIILVGGSGLYADSIIYGIDEIPKIPNEIRDNLNNNFEINGIKYLQSILSIKDPESVSYTHLTLPTTVSV